MNSQLVFIEPTGDEVFEPFATPAYLGLVNSRFHVVAIACTFNLVDPQHCSTRFLVPLCTNSFSSCVLYTKVTAPLMACGN